MTNFPASASQFWTKKRTLAAQFLAEDVLTDEQIAKELGRSRAWLADLKNQPPMQARIASIVEELRQAVLSQGIADVVERTRQKNDRWLRMQRVINERAADKEWQAVPGYGTGLLVHQLKSIGTGRYAQVVDEFAFDAALAAALDRIEREAREDLGQGDDKGASAAMVVNFFGIEPTRLG